MIIQKETRNLIKELAKKYNLTFEETREIVYSQFKYVREELAKGERGGEISTFKNIILKYLGTFYTKEDRLRRIQEAVNKKNEKFNQGI